MKLVELNLETIPYGQPIPFVLRGTGGAMLADKGFVIRDPDDLKKLILRGQTLYIDVGESEDSYRAWVRRVQAMYFEGQRLGRIAGVTMHAMGEKPEADPDVNSGLAPNWTSWQQRLTRLLRLPESGDFVPRFEELFDELNYYTTRRPDHALLALIQMAAEETRFYSASHAMLVAVICTVVARETLKWPENRIVPLGRAALSMKISISELQDVLAQQTTPLTTEQARAIDNHATNSIALLQKLGVKDPLWIDAVKSHSLWAPGKLAEKTLGNQMARLIQRADIFGARIAPRASREPLSVTAAMQACFYDETKSVDEVGSALIKTLGIYPPGAWVKLASGETGIVIKRGASAATPRVAVMLNKEGMATGEPLPRDTTQPAWKIVAPVAHKTVRVRITLERLLTL